MFTVAYTKVPGPPGRASVWGARITYVSPAGHAGAGYLAGDTYYATTLPELMLRVGDLMTELVGT